MPPICGLRLDSHPGASCRLSEGHRGLCRLAADRPKPTKKERIAELETDLALTREELEHQRDRVKRSQERHAQRSALEADLRREIEHVVTQNVATNRARQVAESGREAALAELRVERSQHDDLKEKFGDLEIKAADLEHQLGDLYEQRTQLEGDLQDTENSHLTVQQTVNDLRRELEIAEDMAREREADLAYWKDRAMQKLRGASTPSLLAEVQRRIDS